MSQSASFSSRRLFLAGALGVAGIAMASPLRAEMRKSGTGLGSSGLRGALDATSRGLTPSAGGDQTRLLQKLLDEAALSGETLFLPPGDYFADSLALPRVTRLAGVPGASRLFGPGLALTSAGAERIILDGLSIDGLAVPAGGTGRPLLDIADCPNLTVTECEIGNAAGNALDLTRSGGRIENCVIVRAGLAAIQSRDSSGLAIDGNRIEDCGNGGILVHRNSPGLDASIVTGNRLARIRADAGGTGQNGNGINLFRAHGVTVSNNQLDDCAFSAIRANGGSNAIIAGNQCRNSGETALYAEFQFEGAVISGNLVDGAAIGISIANFNEGGRLAVCTGNLVRNLRTKGPYPADAPGFGMGISVEADTVVSNNVVENAPLYGLKLGWGPYLRNVSATGNVFRLCPVGIAVTVVEGAGTAVLSGNVISGADRGAILGYRWSEAVTGDLAAEGARPPDHLTIAGNAG
ncbi:Tat protein [Aureimonas sp. SA4125]|uniref:TIGR03808 family TAT-translocated repetitive protein n=1 Tax=Aureimonas sp. SA4125 TaxID=2826993 RepID=UPI001CC5A12A|nr:TIGR03808 family TAT-translocated repetitive protein [Aureimonas sp. SA4125]BDA86018.1 Tat protein [Aureimonas sp. SA4125]